MDGKGLLRANDEIWLPLVQKISTSVVDFTLPFVQFFHTDTLMGFFFADPKEIKRVAILGYQLRTCEKSEH